MGLDLLELDAKGGGKRRAGREDEPLLVFRRIVARVPLAPDHEPPAGEVEDGETAFVRPVAGEPFVCLEGLQGRSRLDGEVDGNGDVVETAAGALRDFGEVDGGRDRGRGRLRT